MPNRHTYINDMLVFDVFSKWLMEYIRKIYIIIEVIFHNSISLSIYLLHYSLSLSPSSFFPLNVDVLSIIFYFVLNLSNFSDAPMCILYTFKDL